MFDKVNVKAGVDEVEKSCTLYVSWSWVIPPNTSVSPTCKLFCCGVEQSKLIDRFLFRQQEILTWFDKEVVNFSSPDHDNIFKLFHQNPSNMGNCYFNAVTFRNGDAINRQQPLRFPYEAKNKIFLICVYDGTKMETEVVAVNHARDLSFELAKPKKLFGLFGDDTPMLKNIEGDARQKVLIAKRNGKTTYSMIPKGNEEYYITQALAELNPGDIRIKYLTDFI